MAKMTMVQALNLALHQEMEKDDRVIVLGEDVGRDGGVFRVTEGLIDKFGDKRSVDTPLAESGIIGMSVGMALYGLRPVCEIQFSGFTYEGFHQIESHAARTQVAQPGPFKRAHGAEGALWRGGSGPGAPLREPGGLLCPHTGIEDGNPLRTPKRQGASSERHPRSGPRHILRGQSPLSGLSGGGARRGRDTAHRKIPNCEGGQGHHPDFLWGHDAPDA